MKRNSWASLALASSLLWASGCCTDWLGGCGGCGCGHTAGLFSHGGYSSGAYTSGQGATPCACGNGNAAGVAGAPYPVGGQFITSEGPQVTSPIYMPGPNGAGQPPRIVTVPQAHPTPYTP